MFGKVMQKKKNVIIISLAAIQEKKTAQTLGIKKKYNIEINDIFISLNKDNNKIILIKI